MMGVAWKLLFQRLKALLRHAVIVIAVTHMNRAVKYFTA